MTDSQWRDLLRVLDGELLEPLPVGLIIDSPWLPGWAGISIADYYSSERLWLDANMKAIERFPRVMFLPGFWAEYGMCTEPSAFGARCVFPENDFPFAEKVLSDCGEISRLKKPNCRTDGLLPFVIKRLEHCREEIERAGHAIRFAVSRGPHNIASFLLGQTELLLAIKTDPDEAQGLLDLVTDFVIDWIGYQASCFPSIDGMLLLDDLIGFLGEDDFRQFVVPRFKRICHSFDFPVKLLHNDAHGMITARYLAEMGFNMFNFSCDHSLKKVREAAGDGVTLLGNIPPRDVLAGGTVEDVRRSVSEALSPLDERRRIVLSCGGGTPPGAPSANIEALCEAARR